MEHTVWFDEECQRWLKLTHPGEFGRFPELHYTLDKQTQAWLTEVLLRVATPGEYLRRQMLSRELFGDDVEIEAVSGAGDTTQVLISQGHLVGQTPTLGQIIDFMDALGFYPGPNFSYYQPERQIGAFDAQPRNFMLTPDGVVPIDIILTPIEGGSS